ncbi:MAG TPA: YggT family protein [Spirochaetia bacterium]|jgi:YggT family protein|nr:YggT family protein [Spirochaetia bacterium]
MQLIFRIATGFISIYLVLIFLRILLTWFSGYEHERGFRMLTSITDPYLMLFRKIRLFSSGRIDFSPLFASLLLIVILNITYTFSIAGRITLGLVLAIIIQALWSAVSFILIFFIVLLVVRFVMYLFKVSFVSPVVQTLDTVLSPLLMRVQRWIFKRRIVNYKLGIAFTCSLLIILFLIGRFFIRRLSLILLSLPV